MNYRILLFLIIIFSFSINVNAQEPIRLNEVLIEKTAKKPKVKKFEFKNNKFGKYLFHDLYFKYPDCFYLVDSLPEGTIQEITLHFSAIKNNQYYKGDYKSFKVNKTEFEVTIYEVNEDFSIGKKVNTEPVPIVFEEVEKTRLKTEEVEIDISLYNFKARRFYIGMRRITEITCKDCYYYGPEFFKTGNDNSYIIFKNEKEEYKKAVNEIGFQLRTDVETLTPYY